MNYRTDEFISNASSRTDVAGMLEQIIKPGERVVSIYPIRSHRSHDYSNCVDQIFTLQILIETP